MRKILTIFSLAVCLVLLDGCIKYDGRVRCDVSQDTLRIGDTCTVSVVPVNYECQFHGWEVYIPKENADSLNDPRYRIVEEKDYYVSFVAEAPGHFYVRPHLLDYNGHGVYDDYFLGYHITIINGSNEGEDNL